MKYTCRSCGKLKTKAEFSIHSKCKLGIDISACKACKKAKVDWSKVPIEKRIYNRIKSRATKKKIPFDLELQDIVLPKLCPVFQKPFIYGDYDWTYSVDRKDNSLGYVKGNIQILSNRANRLKGDFSINELQSMITFLSQ